MCARLCVGVCVRVCGCVRVCEFASGCVYVYVCTWFCVLVGVFMALCLRVCGRVCVCFCECVCTVGVSFFPGVCLCLPVFISVFALCIHGGGGFLPCGLHSPFELFLAEPSEVAIGAGLLDFHGGLPLPLWPLQHLFPFVDLFLLDFFGSFLKSGFHLD